MSMHENLQPLDEFAPEAFVGNSVDQDVCNFVLSLALIYNDTKDLLVAYRSLENEKPSGEFEYSPEWGAHNGMENHLQRLQVGMIHELFNLISKSRDVLSDSFFKSVVKQLPKSVPELWADLVDVSTGKNVSGKIGKALLLVRNKVSFHYDPKEVFRGYQQKFCSGVRETPCQSRGADMESTRFYFADASAQEYYRFRMAGLSGDDIAELIEKLNFSIKEIEPVWQRALRVAHLSLQGCLCVHIVTTV